MWWMSDDDMRMNRFAGSEPGSLRFGSPSNATALLVIGDAVPNGPATTATLTFDGAPVAGTLETVGDEDWYKVTLEAGRSYEIGMYAKYGGPSGVPVIDSLFQVRDAAGNVLMTQDNGGLSQHNTLGGSGLDAMGIFIPTVSGTYYINARGFDDGVTGSDTGNYVGDYEVFIRTPVVAPPPPDNSASVLPTTVDTVPDNFSSTVTLNDGGSVTSTIDAPGDRDVYAVHLEAGRSYDIRQVMAAGGPSGIPLADSNFNVYDSTGTLVAAGGIGEMPGGLLLTFVNAQLNFQAPTTGTYYISAEAGSNAAGDYTLSMTSFESYYAQSSPLSSIDWGTQIDRTSRNPDGQEGPRPTDNDYTGTGWNPFGIQGKNVVTY